MTSKDLALFDLDHTLIDVDSDHSWGQFIVQQGLVDKAEYEEANDKFYQDYIASTLDPIEYNEFVANFLKSQTLDDLYDYREKYLERWVIPNMRPKAMDAIKAHRERGDKILVVSATNDFVVVPIAKLFGVAESDVLATRLEVTPDGYTGKVTGRPNFKEGKLLNLQAWIAEQNSQGVTFGKTYAYSDSRNDLPLLEWADVPVCVCPDEILHAHALAHRWAVEDWSI